MALGGPWGNVAAAMARAALAWSTPSSERPLACTSETLAAALGGQLLAQPGVLVVQRLCFP